MCQMGDAVPNGATRNKAIGAFHYIRHSYAGPTNTKSMKAVTGGGDDDFVRTHGHCDERFSQDCKGLIFTEFGRFGRHRRGCGCLYYVCDGA